MAKELDWGSGTKVFFVPKSFGVPVDMSRYVVSDSFMFGFDPAEEGEVKVATLPHITDEKTVSIGVDDLLTVYPELHQCGESNSEFAQKIKRAAEWNRGMEADTDLISRLYPDNVGDEVNARRLKEDK